MNKEIEGLLHKHTTAKTMVAEKCADILGKLKDEDQNIILNLVSAFAVNAGEEDPTVMLLTQLSRDKQFDVDVLIDKLENNNDLHLAAYNITNRMHGGVKARQFTEQEFANRVEEMMFLVAMNQ